MFVYDTYRNNSKIHVSNDGKILLCTNKEVAHPLDWAKFKCDESYFHRCGWACKKCVTKMYKEIALSKAIE